MKDVPTIDEVEGTISYGGKVSRAIPALGIAAAASMIHRHPRVSPTWAISEDLYRETTPTALRNVRCQVYWARRALEEVGWEAKSVWGVGYRLEKRVAASLPTDNDTRLPRVDLVGMRLELGEWQSVCLPNQALRCYEILRRSYPERVELAEIKDLLFGEDLSEKRTNGTVDTYLSVLRDALRPSGVTIIFRRGVGYRLHLPEKQERAA